MDNPIKIGHLYPAAGTKIGPMKQGSAPAEAPGAFSSVLQAQSIKFSQHAETRMRQRGISLNVNQLSQIAGAIQKAEAKGAKDSLVLFKNIAMIVNVPSKTVVTAMDGQALQGNVFTQIDSAVVIS